MGLHTWKIDEPQISKHFHSWLIIRTENELMWVLKTINIQNIYLVINETVVLRNCQCQWESCLYTHSISPSYRKTFDHSTMTSLRLHCLMKMLYKMSTHTHTYISGDCMFSITPSFGLPQATTSICFYFNFIFQLSNDKVNDVSRHSYTMTD